MFFAVQGKGEPFMTWGVGKLVCKLTRGSARPLEGPRDAFSAFHRQEEGIFFLFGWLVWFVGGFFFFFPPSGFSRPAARPPPPAPAARCPPGAEDKRARISPSPPRGSGGGPVAEQRGERPLPPWAGQPCVCVCTSVYECVRVCV